MIHVSFSKSYLSRKFPSVALALLLAGCNQAAPIANGTALAAEDNTDDRLTNLEKRVSTIELNNEVDAAGRVAYLPLSEKTFSFAQADLANFPISIVNVEAYAGGSKVTLKVGNPTSAIVMSLKGTAEWGSVDKNGIAQNDGASKDFEMTNLSPATWNSQEIEIPAMPPSQLGYLRIKNLTAAKVSLPGVPGYP